MLCLSDSLSKQNAFNVSHRISLAIKRSVAQTLVHRTSQQKVISNGLMRNLQISAIIFRLPASARHIEKWHTQQRT